MKYMTHILILASLGLVPVTAMAESNSMRVNPFAGAWEQPVARLAELTREERAKFRNQWQHLPAEEREAMLQELRQQWREVPPEERRQKREELMKRARDRDDKDEDRSRKQRGEDGYGQGYESRQWDKPEYMPRPFERPDTSNSGRGRR